MTYELTDSFNNRLRFRVLDEGECSPMVLERKTRRTRVANELHALDRSHGREDLHEFFLQAARRQVPDVQTQMVGHLRTVHKCRGATSRRLGLSHF